MKFGKKKMKYLNSRKVSIHFFKDILNETKLKLNQKLKEKIDLIKKKTKKKIRVVRNKIRKKMIKRKKYKNFNYLKYFFNKLLIKTKTRILKK